MKNKTINEIGFIKVRRCTIKLNIIEYKKRSDGFYFTEAEIKEIYYTSHPEIKLEQIPAGYNEPFFYRVGDILKSKEGKVFYKTADKISGDL